MAENRRSAPRGGHGHGPQGHGFQRPKDMKGTFRKLMHYLGRYKGALVLVAVCLIVSSAASVGSSYLLKPLLNDYIIPGDFPGLLKMLVVLGGMFALSSLCSFAYARIMVHVAQRTVAAIRQFIGLNTAYRDAATAAQAYAGMMMPAMGNLSKINYAVTCCVGGLLAIGGVFDVGSLGAYLLYVKQVSQPVAQISQQVHTLLAAAAGAERIFAVMDAPAETDDGKTVIVRVEKNGDTLTETAQRTGHWAWKKPDGTLVELRSDVRLEHVTFSYDGEKTVLRDVSLFAKPGQKIAFVGSTGAGKTTITNLINRFYDVQEGRITYDGIDVKDIEKSSLRRSLGMVLQDTHLFTGTVTDNIRYGKLDATDEEVRAAAKLANADAFIRHLPQGYDTVITGDGGSLSQGERQLLAIARAAVSDPPVLILDEATSSIDTRTETLIERGMDSLMEGRTVFVIAHRLSTVRNSQAILVLEHGQIIERGDHTELLAQHGKYYQLYTGAAELS